MENAGALLHGFPKKHDANVNVLARAMGEKIPLKKTKKRLNRTPDTEHSLSPNSLAMLLRLILLSLKVRVPGSQCAGGIGTD